MKIFIKISVSYFTLMLLVVKPISNFIQNGRWFDDGIFLKTAVFIIPDALIMGMIGAYLIPRILRNTNKKNNPTYPKKMP
ncbi:MAG: hypothetical protein Q8R57_10255 [Bacteroidota bacterium]|nr:hypothetical protein [Bacteroidota bacterium]